MTNKHDGMDHLSLSEAYQKVRKTAAADAGLINHVVYDLMLLQIEIQLTMLRELEIANASRSAVCISETTRDNTIGGEE